MAKRETAEQGSGLQLVRGEAACSLEPSGQPTSPSSTMLLLIRGGGEWYKMVKERVSLWGTLSPAGRATCCLLAASRAREGVGGGSASPEPEQVTAPHPVYRVTTCGFASSILISSFVSS